MLPLKEFHYEKNCLIQKVPVNSSQEEEVLSLKVRIIVHLKVNV